MHTNESARPMRRRIAGVFAAVVAAGTISLVQAAPAHAIAPCTFWTTSALTLQEFPWGGSYSTCWANAGTTYLTLPNVRLMESGNNAGSVAYTKSNGQHRTHTFGKNQRWWFTDNYSNPVTITRITIY